MSISLTQILDLAGKLDDAPGDDTPPEGFSASQEVLI